MKGLLALMIIHTILYQLTHWSNALIHCIFIQFYLFSWANKKTNNRRFTFVASHHYQISNQTCTNVQTTHAQRKKGKTNKCNIIYLSLHFGMHE